MKNFTLQDILLVGSACLIVGLYFGMLISYGHRPATPQTDADRDREIEDRLLGRERPRHRATATPAVVRAARMISANRRPSDQ